jgi:ribosomal subunit interface protein
MKIIIKTKNIRLTKALEDFVEIKINQLERFSKVFQPEKLSGNLRGKARAEAEVEIGKSTLHHRKGFFFRAECQILLPGKKLRAEANSSDLRLAITQVKDELQLQLKQYKDKISAKTKRDQRKRKKSLHLASGARFKLKKGQRIREEGI